MFENFENFLNQQYECIDSKECQHDFYISIDGSTCIKCHVQKSTETNIEKTTKKNTNNSIQKELETLNLGDKITEIASAYFLEACGTNIYRGNKRKGILCACIYHAYLKLGDYENFEEIAKKFSLTYKKAAPGFKLVKIKILETRQFVENPTDIAKGIMHQLNLKICEKFLLFLQSEMFLKVTNQLVKKIKIVVASLVFKFIQLEYKSTVKTTDFCNKLGLNCVEFEKYL